MPQAEQFAGLEFPALLEQLGGFAQSQLTRALIREVEVVFHPARVDENLAQTREALDLLERFPSLELPHFSLLEDLGPMWAALAAGDLADNAMARAMLRFLRLCDQFSGFRPKLSLEDYPRLCDCASPWQPLSNLAAETRRIFSEDGEVRDSASPQLDSIRAKLRRIEPAVKAALSAFMKQVKEATGEEALLSLRHQRYCLLVPRSALRLAQGSVVDVSQSGQSVYLEPAQLGEHNIERQQLYLEEEQELRRILSIYSGQVGSAMPALEANLAVLARFDFILARMRHALELRANLPRMRHGGGFLLERAVHPLLYRKFVPEDLRFETQRCLIISGVNAGGKTVLLKLLGLYSLMAAIGCFVPGQAELPYISGIAADIGDGQSTAENLSTFTAHLSFASSLFAELRHMPAGAPPLLVLIDEVGTGTEPSEGQAFAYGLVQELLKLPVILAVTTHYGLLKTIGLEHPAEVKNVSLQFDREKLQPTYNVLDNQPGASFALEIATRWEIPQAVIDAARSVMGSEEQRMSAVISELEQLHADAADAKRQALKLAAEADVLRKQNEELSSSLRQSRERLAKQAEVMKAEMKRRIDELLTETKQRLKSKARSASRKQVDFVQAASDTSQIAREQEGAAEQALSGLLSDLGLELQRIEAEPVEFAVGDKVVIEGAGLRGEVASVDPARRRAEVTVAGKRLTVDLRKLSLADSAPRPHDPLAAYRGKSAAREPALAREGGTELDRSLQQGLQDSYDTLDLHGCTVEEALEKLDEFLSRALLTNANTLRFMHGVGTGRLRQAVQDYLRHNRHVTNVRLANLKEGGAGVTLADLR